MVLQSILVMLGPLLCLQVSNADYSSRTKLHIVYMGSASSDPEAVAGHHHALLFDLLGSKTAAEDSLVYSYKHGFTGFAATLSNSEAAELKRKPGVISVLPSKVRKLHTTHSWDFLGFPLTKTAPTAASNVIIGLLDTGVWPESKSFEDSFLGPVPPKWKGACVSGDGFNSSSCNRKLIGARYYTKGYEKEYGRIKGPNEYRSARDSNGHGTHTASTAGGSIVENASFFGLGNGTARGGAPGARIAAYKVCWAEDCIDADVLAAFDDAIRDGVDILSVSIGSEPQGFFTDALAIGSFHAVEKGILTVFSAGNDGPAHSTVTNVAPWVLTVAASTIDRSFVTDVLLGNNITIRGFSLNTYKGGDSWYPLVYGEDIGNESKIKLSPKYCANGTLDPAKVKGNIVLCFGGIGERIDNVILEHGGSGLLVVDDSDGSTAFSFALPTSSISSKHAKLILQYLRSEPSLKKMAKILPTKTSIHENRRPVVAKFSSRGPSMITPEIIKPDVLAPGVDILGSYSPVATISEEPGDKRTANFNIISGTSMSCPHVAGIAAYVKSLNPSFSPAAIKSAIMTTAMPMKSIKKDNIYAFGSGEISPSTAADPGLIYDLNTTDYMLFLCSTNYTSEEIFAMAGSRFTCPTTYLSIDHFNYPSIAINDVTTSPISITRMLTNVGSAGKVVYKASIEIPGGVEARVDPECLEFSSSWEKKFFSLTIRSSSNQTRGVIFGSLTWFDGFHQVRSPIVVTFKAMTKQ